jgi:phosphoglycerate dehydrogenase-like enzyme
VKRILIDVPVDEASLGRLRALPGAAVEALPAEPPGVPSAAPRTVPAGLLRGAHVLLCKRPPANFGGLDALEFLQLGTVGYEHVRHLGLADRPVRVCNARGVFDTAIGEWSLAMMINLTRDLRVLMRRQEAAAWERVDRFAQEIRGRTVGLWGYGGIGRETARLAKAFGLRVHALTRTGVKPRADTYALAGTGDPEGRLPDRVFTAGQEHEFLSGLDFLVLALPHTRQSEGAVGEAELRALPRSAFVLNPARAPIIREEALLRALREGWVAGAALDTHYAYPLPPEHPLWRLPNVILTPHVSGSDRSQLYPARMGDLFVQNVERYLAGRPLLNRITDAEWREA